MAVVASLCFLAGAVGYVIGRGGPPATDSADVGFLYDMTTHHEQGVELSTLAQAAGMRNDVSVFAREIVLGQSYEIGLMHATLQSWGQAPGNRPGSSMGWMGMAMNPVAMPGMATDAEVEALDQAQSTDAEALFIALMQDHHQGAVEMATEAARRVDDDDVAALAERFARNQRIEIGELEAVRVRLGLPESPPGYSA